MRTLLIITILVLVNAKPKKPRPTNRYGFFRNMEKEPESDTRRVFGGKAADLTEYPAAAALLDRYWTTRCSGAIIAAHWALTAAHCVTSRIAYVKYNTCHPSSGGDHTPVLYLYRHPNYKVVQEDEGRGMDVTLLHHDLGLLRTRDVMLLKYSTDPIANLRRYDPVSLEKQEVMVMGFGRTESLTGSAGEELFSVKLHLTFCERGGWFHCICGTAGSKNEARGVCSGDSGGPVVYRGVQVAVTSMGPLECATSRTEPSDAATSVFTSLYNYIDLINATMADTERILKRRLSLSGTSVFKHHVGTAGMLALILIL